MAEGSERRQSGSASEPERLRRRCDELSASIESMRMYYEDLLGSLQDAIIVVDPTGQIRSINQAAEELIGLSAQPLHARPFEQIFPNDRPLQELVRKTTGRQRVGAGRAQAALRRAQCLHRVDADVL